MFRLFFTSVFLGLIPFLVSAQYMMEPTEPDFNKFSKPASKNITAELNRLTPDTYYSHPEYGINPFNAPCENCVELVDRRKEDERYFVENGTNGQTFYVQSSYGPMHMKDDAGNWITIDSRLKETSSGVFTANNQQFPVKIDAQNKSASVQIPGYEFKFNTALELLHKDANGNVVSLGDADWSDYSAGDDGLKVLNIWPGIDMTMQVFLGRIKTNFILNEKLSIAGGWLIVKDKLKYADNLRADFTLSTQTGENLHDGIIAFFDETGQECFTIERAYVDDDSHAEEPLYLSYELTDEKDFSIYIPIDWLNADERVYPVTIDPLVSASNTLAQASITGSGDGTAWANGNGCPYTQGVTVPANCTVTDLLWSFNYNAIGICSRSQGAVDFLLGTCRSPDLPNFYWFCNDPLPGGSCNGSNISIFSDVNSCIPNPQCAPYSLSITMRFYRNNPFGGSSCNNLCIAAGSPWTVTVQGRTVEIPTITANQTICAGNSATVSASGNYGVPPYTYSWSPGGMNGTSITVSPATTTTYTATITDACNQTATASSTVTVTQNNNPGFNISPNPVCAGQPVTVNGLGAGPSGSYDWTFPSSTTPVVNNNQNPTVTYNSAGTFNMTLNYQQGLCVFPTVQQVTVSPSSGTPSVSVTANPSGAICAGTSVTFTATPTNGGSAPTYQWQVNGTNVGSGGATYTSSTLNNGDAVTVIMTSNSACVSPSTGTSTAIVMTVNPAVVPSVSIAANPSGAICTGTSVTFTATPTNGGGAPTYQWTVNGTNAGTGSTFTSSSLNNGDVVRVVMTSNANCASPATATSNTINVTVNPSVAPSVTIAANPSGAICPGTSVTFTPTPVNGGSTPTYQWQVNGTNTATGSSFTSTTLNNGDVVNVIMTSNANCVSPATATSNNITMNVSSASVPAVSISANPSGPVCAGTSITFTATPTNGGTTPTYQWLVNGTNAGSGATFTSSSLNNNDVVTAVMTSNATCASPTTATSNSINITVTTNLSPAVTISASPSGPVCSGTNVTFTATPTNGGNAPTYQWTVNGTNSGIGATFSSATLNNGDVVNVTMTSSATCVSTPTATSNNIIIQVMPQVAPSVTIAANPSGPVCAGTSVTFTATPTNGGNTPAFQWQVNGTNAGTGTTTFTSSTLSDADDVSVILTSNAACVSPTTATSNVITMTVTPTVTPSVTVAAVPSGQICNGTSVTFTATPTNGGNNPTYQWTVNGTNAGTGATFTSSSLNNNDAVVVTLTSNATCASPTTAASNTIIMNVSSVVVPTISIAAAPSNTICGGTNVTFTTTASGGGNSPMYQWTVNGTNAATGASFSSSTLNDGDVVEVVLTSSSTCANPQTATSNAITMTVTQPVVPSVSIADSPTGTQCSGTNITFTPTPVNGGNNPAYEWFINGVSSGNNATYASSTLNDGDVVSVILTSDAACANPTTTASNSITVDIDQVLNPSVSVAAVPSGTICAGAQVDFTAIPTAAGANPTYQWTVNGTNAGIGSTFSSTTLNDGDVIVVSLTSASPCANPSTANSAPIIMDVNTYVTPSVSITASPSGPICSGSTVTFTASGTNGGSSPTYQWTVNGTNAGTGGTTFVSSSLNQGDVVAVSLTSSEPCTNGNPATSNQITITMATPLTVVVSNDTTVCSSVQTTLTAAASGGDGIYAYTWNNGAGNGNSVDVTPTQTTTYSVTVNDQCGSTPASDNVTVTVNSPVADFAFTPTEASLFNAFIRFENNSSGAVSYLWDFGDGETSTEESPVHTYSSSGDYEVTLTITSSGGCVETIMYVVTIKDEIAFWVPSAFTPNGDGLNDTFFMKGTFAKPYVMRVYNRLGSEIFFTANSEPWNGAIFNVGEVVQNGVYVYEIDLDDSDFKGKTLVGNVTVVRDGR